MNHASEIEEPVHDRDESVDESAIDLLVRIVERCRRDAGVAGTATVLRGDYDGTTVPISVPALPQ